MSDDDENSGDGGGASPGSAPLLPADLLDAMEVALRTMSADLAPYHRQVGRPRHGGARVPGEASTYVGQMAQLLRARPTLASDIDPGTLEAAVPVAEKLSVLTAMVEVLHVQLDALGNAVMGEAWTGTREVYAAAQVVARRDANVLAAIIPMRQFLKLGSRINATERVGLEAEQRVERAKKRGDKAQRQADLARTAAQVMASRREDRRRKR